MESKVAIVTGAGSGIGKASAVALAGAGFSVALLGRRAPLLHELANSIGDRAFAIPTDVTVESEVIAAFERASAQFGRIDVLFNNAGANTPPTPIDEMTVDQWRSVCGVNLDGSFLCAREAFRHMKRQTPTGGRIINNGSISAYVPRPLSAPYTASKHAVTGLTRELALEGRLFDIAVGQIDIGNAVSEMTATTSQGLLQANGSVAPEPVIDVEHVARAVVYMATLPLDVNVPFMTVMAAKMPYIGRG